MNFKDLNKLREIRFNPRITAALLLLVLSTAAAIGINASANKSVYVWAAKVNLAPGKLLGKNDIKKIRVYLPENSKSYYSAKAKIVGSITVRRITKDEIIPVSTLTTERFGLGSRSVPIHVAKNDIPSNLVIGSLVDIYALPLRDVNGKSMANEIAKNVYVESIDLQTRDLGQEVGIVIKLDNILVENFFTLTLNSKLVVVQSAL